MKATNVHAQSLQSCPTLCDPMGCSPPGSSVHGLLQAGIPKWVAISSFLPGIFPTQGLNLCLLWLLHYRWILYHLSSCIADGFFITWAPALQVDSLSLELTAAAAAAKSLQLCPTLCNPIDGSPPGSPIPGILQARTLEWVATAFSNAWKWKVKVKSLSHVWLFLTPRTAAYKSPPSTGFSRQGYWSGVPVPSPLMCIGITY